MSKRGLGVSKRGLKLCQTHVERRKLCRYWATGAGCWKSDECPFFHERPGSSKSSYPSSDTKRKENSRPNSPDRRDRSNQRKSKSSSDNSPKFSGNSPIQNKSIDSTNSLDSLSRKMKNEQKDPLTIQVLFGNLDNQNKSDQPQDTKSDSDLSDVTNNSNECIVLSDGDNMDTNNQQEQRPSSLNNNKRKCSWIQPCENTKKETQREVIKEDAQSETIIKNLNKQLNHTITELDTEKKQVIKLEDNLRDEIEQKSKSQKKYKKEFTDNNQLYHKNTDLKKENTALKDELEQLKEAIKVITNENSDKSVKLIELTKSFEDSRNENVDLNLENKDLSDEKVKVITEHHNLKLENDKLQEEIPKSKIQIENTYHQTMKEFKDGHEAEFESYKIEFENFRANLNDSLIKLQKKNEQLTDKAVEDITKFEKLKLEHDILVESLNTKIKDLEDKITKQNSDISKVTTELQLSIYKSEELISKLNDKDTENKANQIKFNNLETKLIEQIDLNEKNDETLKLIKNNNGKELEALNRRFKDQHQTLLLRINEIENFKFLITDLNMKNRELEIKDIAKTEEIKKLKDICSQTQIYVAKLEEKYRVDLDKEINKKNVEINQLEQKNMHFINILTNSYQQFQAVVAPKANYDIKP